MRTDSGGEATVGSSSQRVSARRPHFLRTRHVHQHIHKVLHIGVRLCDELACAQVRRPSAPDGAVIVLGEGVKVFVDADGGARHRGH